MKANLCNLKQVLSICAQAHNTTLADWSKEESHFLLKSDTPATLCDVRMILDAFYNRHDNIETDWGFTIVWLDEEMDTDNDVNLSLCALALPYGTDLSKLS